MVIGWLVAMVTTQKLQITQIGPPHHKMVKHLIWIARTWAHAWGGGWFGLNFEPWSLLVEEP